MVVETAASLDKRATLMREAATLFRTLGYHATSMSDIAEVMQLNKGTLYYYFPSKADILYGVYLEAFARLDENIEAIPGGLPPDELLVQYVRAILRTIGCVPDFIAVYFQEHPWLEKSLGPEHSKAVRAKEAEFTAQLRAVINEGMRQGVFRRVNDQLLAAQLLSMISSLYRWHLSEDERSASLVADTIISYLYEGVLARPR